MWQLREKEALIRTREVEFSELRQAAVRHEQQARGSTTRLLPCVVPMHRHV